ncbi:hypothetical protein ABIE26_004650 [Pedobacter africanus]|uniref:Uncharacterized protein n=1 Tax=Pedobacter africanus TaxID=151894 RepID=A0ACC6L3G2_9SPHI|nr:DUF4129 domain-containing protein [Pedobacter africanus]MDR6785881.1 hypothetical protein [Pedobacter africanus]
MYKALALLILLCTSAVCFPAAAPALAAGKSVLIKNDSTKLELRNFNQQKIQQYKTEKEFLYEEAERIDLSYWDRFWKWFWSLFDGVVSNEYSGGILKYLVMLLAAGLIVFIVVKFSGLDLKIFAGKAKAVDVPYSESPDNIHEINFNEEIDKAVAAANYRLAVRLFYLKSLKLLNDKALIDWQPEKTNQTYISELTDPDKKTSFTALTTQFEYIWYGEFFIDREHFIEVKDNFERFNLAAG